MKAQAAEREEEQATASVRIAVVVSHPIQYFAPWHRGVAMLDGVNLKVFFCTRSGANEYFDVDFGTKIKWDVPLLEGYDWEFLPKSEEIKSTGFFAVDNPRVGEALSRFAPDVVIVHGYASRTMWRVARWCRKNRVALMLYSDSNATNKRSAWKRLIKEIVVRYFYGYVSAALTSGDNNREYHRSYGVKDERLLQCTMPIDTERMLATPGLRTEFRSRHGIPQGAFVVAFSGKLTPLKCVDHLLKAVLDCTASGRRVWALLIGDGPERQRLETFVRENGMKNVIFTGFVNQSSIGECYRAADVIVLMSIREAKGLVIPEAGCFGCPAIVSDRVGSIGSNDSAQPGVNALVYPWGDIEALAGCIARLYDNGANYRAMSEAAIRIAKQQDVGVAANLFREAAIRAVRLGPR